MDISARTNKIFAYLCSPLNILQLYKTNLNLVLNFSRQSHVPSFCCLSFLGSMKTKNWKKKLIHCQIFITHARGGEIISLLEPLVFFQVPVSLDSRIHEFAPRTGHVYFPEFSWNSWIRVLQGVKSGSEFQNPLFVWSIWDRFEAPMISPHISEICILKSGFKESISSKSLTHYFFKNIFGGVWCPQTSEKLEIQVSNKHKKRWI